MFLVGWLLWDCRMRSHADAGVNVGWWGKFHKSTPSIAPYVHRSFSLFVKFLYSHQEPFLPSYSNLAIRISHRSFLVRLAMALNFPLLGALALLLLLYRSMKKKNYNSRLPPQPPSIPLIGNIHQFIAAAKKNSIHLLLERWARQYGEVFRVQLGPIDEYYLNSDLAVKVCHQLWLLSFM